MANRIAITHKMRTFIRAERCRTDVSYYRLLNGRDDFPVGFGYAHVNGWLDGTVKSAQQDHFDYVIGLWASLPSVSERITISDDVRAQLISEAERTNVSPFAVIKDGAIDAPTGLTGQIVKGWLCGATTTARKDHLDFMLSCWHGYPDAIERIPVTEEDRLTMLAEKERTGVGLTRKLLSGAPGKLSGTIVQNWMDGKTGNARADQLRFILDRWASFPSRTKGTPESTKS